MALLDTYQLKSLDAVAEAEVDKIQMKVVKVGNRLKLKVLETSRFPSLQKYDNNVLRHLYDKIIVCFGFQFENSIFSR